MRHQKKGHKLGRTAAHRKATLAALAGALIEHKRIETTLPKARALRTFVEPIITRAKDESTHNRRQAFRHLRSKEAVKELFGEVASNIGDRPGGYTRIVRLGLRQGDSAEMAVIELVDWNDVRPEGSSRKKTRRGGGRSRRGRGRSAATTSETAPKAQAPKTDPESEAPAEAEPQPEADAAGVDTPAEEQSESSDPAAQGTSTKAHSASNVAPHPEAGDHPDQSQGASPGTGAPHPETGKGDQGTSGGSRHRG